MLRKNVASQFIYFAGINATTGAFLTGATFSGRRSIDGTFAAIGGTISEDTGTGFYKVALTQADTNGNDIAFFFTATNAVPVCMTVLATAANPSDVTAYGLTNIDTTVSSRMETYTQPSGFLAATFPTGTVANTTNITAGTITTVTNLTNAPTAGDLTATMKASVTTAATAATPTAAAVSGAVGSVTGNVGGSVASVVGLTAANLDATISSRLASASYTAPLDASGTRTAIGLASADLDAQLAALPTAAEIVAAQLTTAITEAYRTNGAAPTLAEFMSEVLAHLGESSIVATTKTIKRFDRTTTAETFTLDSATAPTAITRAT